MIHIDSASISRKVYIGSVSVYHTLCVCHLFRSNTVITPIVYMRNSLRKKKTNCLIFMSLPRWNIEFIAQQQQQQQCYFLVLHDNKIATFFYGFVRHKLSLFRLCHVSVIIDIVAYKSVDMKRKIRQITDISDETKRYANPLDYIWFLNMKRAQFRETRPPYNFAIFTLYTQKKEGKCFFFRAISLESLYCMFFTFKCTCLCSMKRQGKMIS